MSQVNQRVLNTKLVNKRISSSERELRSIVSRTLSKSNTPTFSNKSLITPLEKKSSETIHNFSKNLKKTKLKSKSEFINNSKENNTLNFIEEILTSLTQILLNILSWRSMKPLSFKEICFKNPFSPSSIENKKTCKISEKLTELNNSIFQLIGDIETLSKTSPWKNTSIHKPVLTTPAKSITDILAQAKSHLHWLKKDNNLDIHKPSNNDFERILQLELQQSLRDRRSLEAQLIFNKNPSLESLLLSIEQTIEDHSML